ncbi:MAG: hypothetical protein B7Y51_08605 [Burkholderiales bacterium 28-67-8]|nr:MAG: hypothetical protein B7Y51_08605 [Burkholderiales bacterium 28-67-8]
MSLATESMVRRQAGAISPDALKQMQSAVFAADELLSSLAMHVRLDRDELKPELEDISVQDMLERIDLLFATRAQHTGLRWRVLPSLCKVRSNPLLLERMVCDLVANAMRYTPQGGVLLSWEPGGTTSFTPGSLFIVVACLCWAIDNNLTRKVSTNDAMLVAALKGLVAGSFNTALALGSGASWPSLPGVWGSLLVGFFGYGLSLTLFVVGLRTLGTARTGAYFCVAPLFGVIISLAVWHSVPGPTFWLAAGLMALGVWMHIRERHVHQHTHEPLEHAHEHRHDEHHRHEHAFAWRGDAPHVHSHRHEVITHEHPHYPDVHHRHTHRP